MIHKIKLAYGRAEMLLTRKLPPKAVYYLLPTRMRIANIYLQRHEVREAAEYVALATKNNLVFQQLSHAETEGTANPAGVAPLTAALSEPALRTLISTKTGELASSAKTFNGLGRLRIAAAYRAGYLLRRVLDNMASGRDEGQTHDAFILEIGANDCCRAIIDRPGVISSQHRETLIRQVEEAANWPLDRKLSVFIDAQPGEAAERMAHVRSKTIKLQGPSKRDSNLSEKTADLFCVMGYEGVQSVVAPSDRIDVSLYPPTKIKLLSRDQKLDCLGSVGLPVIAQRGGGGGLYRDLCKSVVAEYYGVHSNVRYCYCYSEFNTGVEFFLWLIGAGSAHLTVTNFDMFINKNYPTGYTSTPTAIEIEGQLESKTTRLPFFLHDPSQQYAIYKIFHRHEEVEYDSVLDDTISAPLSAYVDALEITYRS